MRKRGRKSTAELSIIAVSVDGYRPEPPADLRDPEVQIWRNIVSSVPGGWFSRSNEPLLAAYCRHVATSDRLAKLVEKVVPSQEPDVLKRWDKLLGMRERESKAALSLARAMRLTQQAQMHPRTAGRAMPESTARKLWDRKPPWEVD
jgi:hypothetical protein